MLNCKKCDFQAASMSEIMTHIRKNHGWSTWNSKRRIEHKGKPWSRKQKAKFKATMAAKREARLELTKPESIRGYLNGAGVEPNPASEMTVKQLLTHMQSQSDFLNKAIALVAGIASHHEEMK